VSTFALVKPYRPALYARVVPELDRVAGNLARLYGVDIAAKTAELAEDEFARRRRDYLASMPETQEVVGRGAVGSVPV